ncbi:MAG: efflux RND transporter periplasmic adaptor subunit [Phycisphaerae bacterium]
MKNTITTVVILLIVAILGYWVWEHFASNSSGRVIYQTAAVKQGKLAATVSATGTLEPRDVVDVGAQVNGTILSFGKDANGHPVDYDSPVNKGTVLARIDPANYEAQVALAKASLAEAQANVEVAVARLAQYQAAYVDARADWLRAEKMGASGTALAITQYDAYKSTYDQAKANVALGQASLVQAQKAVDAAKAALNNAEITLGYCTISSPVKGVVIDRRVDIGQTVASSFNTPSLFLLAEDLDKIQVWASVNEADIGRIKVGDPATFTVDAFPDTVFHGVVSQIRLNATMVQNVVTYTVVVDTNNPGGKLLPYLTAQTDFLVAKRNNVMMVPNAALRWVPLNSEILPSAHHAAALSSSQQGTVWVAVGKYVRPIVVTVGLANNYDTQIESPDIKPGMRVVIGERANHSTTGSGGTNPFLPQPFKHKSHG